MATTYNVPQKKRSMYRLQFELGEEEKKAWDDMKKIFNLKRNKDLLNNALTFLAWASSQIHSDRIIASVDEKNEKYRELSMPIFNQIKRRPSK